MSNNDEVSDFHSTGHLLICWMSKDPDSRCNRDCTHRLMDVAVRLEGLLNPRHTATDCPNTYKAQPCVLDATHVEQGQVFHESADGTRWPSHRPWNPDTGYDPVL